MPCSKYLVSVINILTALYYYFKNITPLIYLQLNEGFPDDVINRVKIQTSDIEITKDGNNYTIKTVTPYKTWVNTFELGVEFERTRYGIANAKVVNV